MFRIGDVIHGYYQGKRTRWTITDISIVHFDLTSFVHGIKIRTTRDTFRSMVMGDVA